MPIAQQLSSEDEEWLTEMSMAELDSSTLSEDDSNYLVKSDDFVDASEFEDQHDLSQSEVAQKWTQALQTVESPNGSKAAAVRRATHRRRQNRTNSVEVPEFSPPSLVVEDTQEVKKSPPRLVWEPVTGTIATRPHQSVSFSGSTLTESLKREAEMNGPLKGKEEEKGKAEGDPLAPAAQVPHPNRGHRRRQVLFCFLFLCCFSISTHHDAGLISWSVGAHKRTYPRVVAVHEPLWSIHIRPQFFTAQLFARRVAQAGHESKCI